MEVYSPAWEKVQEPDKKFAQAKDLGQTPGEKD